MQLRYTRLIRKGSSAIILVTLTSKIKGPLKMNWKPWTRIVVMVKNARWTVMKKI